MTDPIVVRKVPVILDRGDQGFRDITTEAWAVIMQDRLNWPSKCLLLGIHMTEDAANEDRQRFEDPT